MNIWLDAFMIGAYSFKFGKSGILIKNTPKIGEVIRYWIENGQIKN
jgi:hypothetical protein